MILENELCLPDPLVRAIANDSYSPGTADFTVTQLIAPVRIVSLRKKWGEHLVEDASDRIFSLIGQSIHTILERAADPRYIIERRYSALFNGISVSGQIDVYDTLTSILSDYKVCSRYVVGDGPKPEWIAQANINQYLMQDDGYKPLELQVVAIFRDWSKLAASRSTDYPPRQVQILPLPLWSNEKVKEYVFDRIAAHTNGTKNPPVCSPEERWERPAKFALMKKGQKRAVKLFDTEDQAREAAGGLGQYIESRPGENVRCLHYCPVNKYCSFYQNLMQESHA